MTNRMGQMFHHESNGVMQLEKGERIMIIV